jgi:hypothetical protein
LIQRLSTATALIIEGPMTLFIMSPFASHRSFAAVAQILLQVLIFLTGNYGFFNILTMILCIPLMDHTAKRDNDNGREPSPRRQRFSPWPSWISSSILSFCHQVLEYLCYLMPVVASYSMFEIIQNPTITTSTRNAFLSIHSIRFAWTVHKTIDSHSPLALCARVVICTCRRV